MNSESFSIFLELLFCLIDAVLLYRFACIFMDLKYESNRLNIALIILTGIASFGLSFMSHYSTFGTILLLVSIMTYIYLTFDSKPSLKLSIGFSYYISLGIVTSMIASLFSLFINTDLNYIHQNIVVRAIVGLLIKITYFIFVKGIRIVFKKKTVSNFLNSMSIQFFFFASFMVLLILFEYLFLQNHLHANNDSIYYIVFVFGTVFFIVVIFILEHYRNKTKIALYEHTIQEMRLKEDNEIRNLEHSVTIMNLKHDLSNHLVSITNLIENNKKEAALKYIESIYSTNAMRHYVDSDNDTINALLNHKISKFPEIYFKLRIDIADFRFDPKILTVILGNVIDNAIEAVNEVPESNKEIEITISENLQFGKIVIINPYQGEIKISKGRLLSKKRKNKHGLGLISVKNALEACDGKIEYSTENQVFRVAILLPKS